MRIEKRLAEKIEKYYKKRARKSVYFYPLAVFYFNNKQFDKAYQILLDGLQHYPRYAIALVKIGEILASEGNYDSAIAYLETAANIQKDNTKALELLAQCYEKSSMPDKAQMVYEKLVDLTNDNKYKEKLLQLAPKVKPTENDLEKITEQIQNTEKDIPTIELEEEEEEQATITLARLYEKQGYVNDAIETYKKILKKEPDNIEAKEALERLLNDVGLKEGEKQ